jgi:hypothetical protein
LALDEKPADVTPEVEGTAEAERPAKQEKHARDWPATLLRVAFVLAVPWAFLQVAYFWRSNTVLWNQGELRPWGVFSGLFRPDWSFSWANSPPLEVLAAVFLASITTALGMLILAALDVRAGLRTRLCLGFVVGAGVSGIVFELVTMAGLLVTPVVWIVWIALLGGAGWLAHWRNTQPTLRWWGRRPPEDSKALWPQLDKPGAIDRRVLVNELPLRAEIVRLNEFSRAFWWLGALLVGVITLTTFWHALFYPETYWDSLILYLGYARMTFLEGVFPFKAEAQVGIGLGANYPHLYPNYGAIGSTMFGAWSDMYQAFAAPLAGLIATLLIYDTVRLCFGRPAVAMAAAVLFRAVPYGIAYSTYASDYSWAIMVTAAFLLLCGMFARTRLPGTFAVLTFIPAMAMHLNYLMGILWVPWGIAVICALAQWPARKSAGDGEVASLSDDNPFDMRTWRDELGREEGDPPTFPRRGVELDAADAYGVVHVLKSHWFWAVLILCMVLGNTWHVRNYVLTGNPVYAFFPDLFPKSVRINKEVLDSAHLEWFRHGDGIARLAEQYVDIAADRPIRDQGASDFAREAGVRHRVMASWQFWQGFETFRDVGEDKQLARGRWLDRLRYLALVTRPVPERDALTGDLLPTKSLFGHEVRLLVWPHAYKMAPLALGFALTGLVLAMLMLAFRRASTRAELIPLSWRVFATVSASAAVLGLSLLAFHYLLGDFYLYQIIPVLLPMAFFAAIPFVAWRSVPSPIELIVHVFLGVLVLATGLVPGVAMGLLNFKILGPAQVDGVYYDPFGLDHFRHPGMPADTVWGMRFGEDVRMWNDVNDIAKGMSILTHENRHRLYDPSIELVHLDDWDVQQVWGAPMKERLEFFRKRGIRYYLRVPIEFSHPINERAGIQELIDAGELELIIEHGENQLYEFRYAFEPQWQ